LNVLEAAKIARRKRLDGHYAAARPLLQPHGHNDEFTLVFTRLPNQAA
jgi:hypothetical protein